MKTKQEQVLTLISKIIVAVERRLPEYLADEEDQKNNKGNCALCLIDEFGGIHGKLFGKDQIRLRNSFRLAWIKCSQVWITGLKTGEFEKQVYAGELDDGPFGIIRPDFIGWEGGQPIVLDGNIKLAAGFSGFRGTSDLAIVQQAVADALSNIQQP